MPVCMCQTYMIKFGNLQLLIYFSIPSLSKKIKNKI